MATCAYCSDTTASSPSFAGWSATNGLPVPSRHSAASGLPASAWVRAKEEEALLQAGLVLAIDHIRGDHRDCDWRDCWRCKRCCQLKTHGGLQGHRDGHGRHHLFVI